jgi:hypothetical protein
MSKQLDKEAFQVYLRTLNHSVQEQSNEYQRYVLSAYPYFRARLLVPGRNHADEDSGSLAIGGSAPVDVIDLDIWLSKQPAHIQEEALQWIRGSSLEQTAYWRGLGKASRSTIKRRRDKIVENYVKSTENATNGPKSQDI